MSKLKIFEQIRVFLSLVTCISFMVNNLFDLCSGYINKQSNSYQLVLLTLNSYSSRGLKSIVVFWENQNFNGLLVVLILFVDKVRDMNFTLLSGLLGFSGFPPYVRLDIHKISARKV